MKFKNIERKFKDLNLKRRKSKKFKINDIVDIKCTQQGPCLKLNSKFLDPYKMIKVKNNDAYDIQKILLKVLWIQVLVLNT